MASGGPGDHPLSDVIFYDMEIYGKEADSLLKSLESLLSRRELWDWWEQEIGWSCSRADALGKIKHKFLLARTRAKSQGWEMK